MTRWQGLVVCLLVAGCRDETSSETAPTATVSAAPLLEASEQDEADAGPQKHGEAKQAGERAEIPAGKVVVGSTPGDRGRDPSLEPALMTVELGGFEIDRLPYPNDPAEKPLTGVPRAKAAELCAARDGRLCSEIEWERACKGPADDPYAGGRIWDEGCAEPSNRCASGFDVLAMGALREWTASDVAVIENVVPAGSAAVRGAGSKAASLDHRCAHRAAVSPATGANDLGFRCCYGAAPTATIPSPSWSPKLKKVDFPPSKLAELFRASERLAPFAADIKYFHEEAAAETVLRRGKASGLDAGTPPARERFITSPMLWSPIPGETILLVTGQSGKDSFIVAFHQLPEGRYRVGAAMLMKNELGPVVLVDDGPSRWLRWTTCWGCYGTSGKIDYRSENRVVITQQ